MSLRIRLSRVGAKKQPSYRIVVADAAAPRDGRVIATLGHYNPLTNPYTLKVDEEQAVSWLQKGALPSETARSLLNKAGVITTYEHVRHGESQKPRYSTEEIKARREARPARTAEPRLARPTKREGAEGISQTAAPTAAARRPPAGRSRAAAGRKTGSTASTRRRPSRTKSE